MSDVAPVMPAPSAASHELARPRPIADETSQPYWEAAASGRLVLQRCGSCRRFQHPPGPVCRSCYATRLGFEPVSGRARVYSFTVSHVAFVPEFASELPLIIALLEIEEQPGVRLLGNVRGLAAEDVNVGMELSVVFEDIGDGLALPQFAPPDKAREPDSA